MYVLRDIFMLYNTRRIDKLLQWTKMKYLNIIRTKYLEIQYNNFWSGLLSLNIRKKKKNKNKSKTFELKPA